jgi:hypothetical protein
MGDKKWIRCLGKIDLAQDRDRWQRLVNMVINFMLSKNVRNLTF